MMYQHPLYIPNATTNDLSVCINFRAYHASIYILYIVVIFYITTIYRTITVKPVIKNYLLPPSVSCLIYWLGVKIKYHTVSNNCREYSIRV